MTVIRRNPNWPLVLSTGESVQSEVGEWVLDADGSVTLTTAAVVSLLGAAGTDLGQVSINDGGIIEVGDGVYSRPGTPNGWSPFAPGYGNVNFNTADAASFSLAAVAAGLGGTYKWPVVVTAPMLLQAAWIWNTNTASARSAEWGLYDQALNNNATGTQIASGTYSFTPAAASWRSSTAASAPVLVGPGLYWFVIRNTSTTQTFGVGRGAAGGTGAPSYGVYNASIAALGATFDLETLNSAASNPLMVMLEGRVFGNAGTGW